MDMNLWTPSPSVDDLFNLDTSSLPLFDIQQSDSVIQNTCVGSFSDLMAESYEPVEAVSLHDQLQAYRHRNVEDWSGQDCFDWAYTESRNSCLQPAGQDTDSGISRFQYTTGREMLGYSEQDFKSLVDPYNGPFFYEKFKDTVLKRQQEQCQHSETPSFHMLENMTYPNSQHEDLTLPSTYTELGEEQTFGGFGYTYRSTDILDSSFDNSLDLLDVDEYIKSDGDNSNSYEGENYYTSPLGNYQNVDQDMQQLELKESNASGSSTLYNLLGEHDLGSGFAGSSIENQQLPVDSADEFMTSPHWFNKIPTGGPRKNRVRNPKSWEFVIRLLQDPRTTPRLVDWEDEAEGIFRLKQKEIISQMWGSRSKSNAEALKYESFARLLRHHYKSECVLPVKEKQMVYRFGPAVLEQIKQGKRW